VDAATGNDVNDGGLGAILIQTDEKGKERVITYASKALVNHEKNCTPFLLEILVASWAMDYFDTYLKGKKIKLFIDHKTLEKLSTIHTNRLQEQMNIFDFTIHYKKGSEMPEDFLSCIVCDLINKCQSYKRKIQCAKSFPTSVKTWTIQRQIKNHSNHQKPMQISSNTHKNCLFKMTFYEFDTTKWREHQELYYLFHKF